MKEYGFTLNVCLKSADEKRALELMEDIVRRVKQLEANIIALEIDDGPNFFVEVG